MFLALGLMWTMAQHFEQWIHRSAYAVAEAAAATTEVLAAKSTDVISQSRRSSTIAFCEACFRGVSDVGARVERTKLAFDALFSYETGKYFLFFMLALEAVEIANQVSQLFLFASTRPYHWIVLLCTVLCLNGLTAPLPFLVLRLAPETLNKWKVFFSNMLSAVLDIVWDVTYLVIAISISTRDDFSGDAWFTAVLGVAIPAIGAAKVIHELVSAERNTLVSEEWRKSSRGGGADRPRRRSTIIMTLAAKPLHDRDSETGNANPVAPNPAGQEKQNNNRVPPSRSRFLLAGVLVAMTVFSLAVGSAFLVKARRGHRACRTLLGDALWEGADPKIVILDDGLLSGGCNLTAIRSIVSTLGDDGGPKGKDIMTTADNSILPASLERLVNLERLVLDGHRVAQDGVPAAILDGNIMPRLTLLMFGSQDPVNKVLDLSSSMSGRTRIPSNVFRFFTGLEELRLRETRVSCFPPTAALQRLRNLRQLDLSGTNISYLPPSLIFSQSRIGLNLSGSPVARALNWSGHALRDLSEQGLGDSSVNTNAAFLFNWTLLSTTLPDLETLDLSFNSLKDFSALRFSDLRSLHWLSLNHNKRLVPVEKGSVVFSWDPFIHHPLFSMLHKDPQTDVVFLGLADTGMSSAELSLLASETDEDSGLSCEQLLWFRRIAGKIDLSDNDGIRDALFGAVLFVPPDLGSGVDASYPVIRRCRCINSLDPMCSSPASHYAEGLYELLILAAASARSVGCVSCFHLRLHNIKERGIIRLDRLVAATSPSRLIRLDLEENDWADVPNVVIPDSLYRRTKLKFLNLARCGLIGKVSPQFRNLRCLKGRTNPFAENAGMMYPACESRDGLANNTQFGACTCGSKICMAAGAKGPLWPSVAAPGMFCAEKLSMCHAQIIPAPCSSSMLGGERCRCGTSICERMQICYAPLSQCRAKGENFTLFAVLAEGNCETEGFEWINTLKGCQEVAASMGFSDVIDILTFTRPDFPRGCLIAGIDGYSIELNLKINAVEDDCGAFRSNCVCQPFLGQPCADQLGTIANHAPCICGAKRLCGANKPFCYGPRSLCSETSAGFQVQYNSSAVTMYPACYPQNGMQVVSSTTVGAAGHNNSGGCLCGVSGVCKAARTPDGIFCNGGAGTCAKFATCVITNGTFANPASCACGNAECTNESTGLFCFDVANLCASKPIFQCTHEGGDIPNYEQGRCVCGTTWCASGTYCYAPLSQCRMDRSHFTVYPVLNLDSLSTCGSNGLHSIDTVSGCSAAASAVTVQGMPFLERLKIEVSRHEGVGVETAPGWTTEPFGCAAPAPGNMYNFPILASPASPLNPGLRLITKKTGFIGDVCGANSWACICALFTAPPCDDQTGTVPHTSSSAGCVCGMSTVCTSQTGLLCNAPPYSNGRCRHAAACLHREGRVPNLGVCRCGAIDCTSATGFYCDDKNDLCARKALLPCANSKGDVSNEEQRRCTCGRSLCDNQTGMFCYGPLSQCQMNHASFKLYPFLAAGRCTSKGYGWIDSEAECTAAARAWGRLPLGYGGRLVVVIGRKQSPAGCILYSDTGMALHFLSYDIWIKRYNDKTKNISGRVPPDCGKNSFDCFCAAFVGKPCDEQTGTEANRDSCICGATAVCTPLTGLVCDASGPSYASCSNETRA
jgi:hypothetical protein